MTDERLQVLMSAARAVRDAVHGENRSTVHPLLLGHEALVPVDEAIHGLCCALFEAGACDPCTVGDHDECYYWTRRRWWSPCECPDASHEGKPRPVDPASHETNG